VSSEVNSLVIIDHNQMERLRRSGYPAQIAINGPNEGPPQYSVPRSALDQCHAIREMGPQPLLESAHMEMSGLPTNQQHPIDPAPGPPKRRLRQSRRADDRTLEEAKKIVKGPGRSLRSHPDKRQLRPR
jgi:hypothetical protein